MHLHLAMNGLCEETLCEFHLGYCMTCVPTISTFPMFNEMYYTIPMKRLF